MDEKSLDKNFKRLLHTFTADAFMQANSKFTSMDDMIWRSGFGIMNLLEVENVNQEKWNEYIAKHTECATWHQFGKLAMIAWMEAKLAEDKKAKN